MAQLIIRKSRSHSLLRDVDMLSQIEYSIKISPPTADAAHVAQKS